MEIGTKFDVQKSFKSQFQVEIVRGCEIEGILSPEGRVIEEMGKYIKKFFFKVL